MVINASMAENSQNGVSRSLSLTDQHPDILGLCDTFLDDKVDNKFLQRKSYVTERRDRVGKSGGGIFCYIHES